jgi:hypothetical protein
VSVVAPCRQAAPAPPSCLYCTCAGQLADKVHVYWALIDNGTMPINASQPPVILLTPPPELSSVDLAVLATARPWSEAAAGSGGLTNSSPGSGTSSGPGTMETSMGFCCSSSGSGSGLGGFGSGQTAPIPMRPPQSTAGLAVSPNSVWPMVLGAALALHIALLIG